MIWVSKCLLGAALALWSIALALVRPRGAEVVLDENGREAEGIERTVGGEEGVRVVLKAGQGMENEGKRWLSLGNVLCRC